MSKSAKSWFRSLRRAAALTALLSGLHAGAVAAHGGEAHGDHEPHHGGAVLMYQSIHYETVLLPRGGVQLWITDEMRNDLPAATVSEVAVEIVRPDGKSEAVDMAISKSGEYWEGSSQPVTDPKSTVRMAFLLHGTPVMVDIPGTLWPELLKKAGKSAGAHAHGH